MRNKKYQANVAKCIHNEKNVIEKIDNNGCKWWSAYLGSGAHFKNWLDQYIEIFGKENVDIEKVDVPDLKCFEETGGKAYRIWIRQHGIQGVGDSNPLVPTSKIKR